MVSTGAVPLTPKPSADLRRCLGPSNFRLAWDRLLRAGEPRFKWYWRPSAAIASTIIQKLLLRLRTEVRKGIFHPDHACLFSEPKPSGLLRHMSILSLGDLIVYQAVVNVIADRVHQHSRRRFGRSVFGNIYSGPKSPFFLRDWRLSYRTYNQANRDTFSSGHTWLAQFDFASFYDSIGHQVLSTILQQQFGIGADLCSILTGLLGRWSSATDADGKKLPRIYLDHGIPQGPQPSALLAEVILTYIDDQMVKRPGIRYIRYADDIKIWGRDEESVRYAAAILDRLARNIGLYPQTKKFGVQKVTDVEAILKSVSMPHHLPDLPDSDISGLDDELKRQPTVRQLWDILRQFAETGQVEDVTRFKYLLAISQPTADVAMRLCKLMRTRPELTDTCCYYVDRCNNPTPELLDQLLALAEAFPGYAWMSGRILRTTWVHAGALSSEQARSLGYIVARAIERNGIRSDCQLQGVAHVLAVTLGISQSAGIEAWATDPKTHWWGIVFFIREARSHDYGEAAFVGLMQKLLAHGSKEVCRAAAYRLCLLGSHMPNVAMDAEGECRAIFLKYGLGAHGRKNGSRINHLFRELCIQLNLQAGWFKPLDWKGILKNDHDDVQKYIVRLLAEHRASRDEFILCLDSALETVFDSIWISNGYLDIDLAGRRLKPKRGHRMRSTTLFSTDYPHTRRFFIAVNDLRNRSEVAHRKNTVSRTQNSRISFNDIEGAVKFMPAALTELARIYPGV